MLEVDLNLSDLVALVTNSFLAIPNGHQEAAVRASVQSCPLPERTEPVTVSQQWHQRVDADPSHRWLLGLVHVVCRG
jgi:hypothetical protein